MTNHPKSGMVRSCEPFKFWWASTHHHMTQFLNFAQSYIWKYSTNLPTADHSFYKVTQECMYKQHHSLNMEVQSVWLCDTIKSYKMLCLLSANCISFHKNISQNLKMYFWQISNSVVQTKGSLMCFTNIIWLNNKCSRYDGEMLTHNKMIFHNFSSHL